MAAHFWIPVKSVSGTITGSHGACALSTDCACRSECCACGSFSSMTSWTSSGTFMPSQYTLHHWLRLALQLTSWSLSNPAKGKACMWLVQQLSCGRLLDCCSNITVPGVVACARVHAQVHSRPCKLASHLAGGSAASFRCYPYSAQQLQGRAHAGP